MITFTRCSSIPSAEILVKAAGSTGRTRLSSVVDPIDISTGIPGATSNVLFDAWPLARDISAKIKTQIDFGSLYFSLFSGIYLNMRKRNSQT